MTDAYSLIIAPDHVEHMAGRLDGPTDVPVTWNGRALRLVHEQREPTSGVVWYIYGDISLSKPETLQRAQRWADGIQHPKRPHLRE